MIRIITIPFHNKIILPFNLKASIVIMDITKVIAYKNFSFFLSENLPYYSYSNHSKISIFLVIYNRTTNPNIEYRLVSLPLNASLQPSHFVGVE